MQVGVEDYSTLTGEVSKAILEFDRVKIVGPMKEKDTEVKKPDKLKNNVRLKSKFFLIIHLIYHHIS